MEYWLEMGEVTFPFCVTIRVAWPYWDTSERLAIERLTWVKDDILSSAVRRDTFFKSTVVYSMTLWWKRAFSSALLPSNNPGNKLVFYEAKEN